MSNDSRLSASYHVLVVGSELSGLIYGALAARAGYRVGVIAHGMKPNTYRHQGHAFTRQPERFYGFRTSPLISRVFSELSLGMEMRNRPQAVTPSLQFVTPTRRIDLLQHAERWRRELDRELGDTAAALSAYERWAQQWSTATDALLMSDAPLPPSGMRAARHYAQLIEGCEGLLVDESGHGQNPLMTRRGGGTCRAIIDGTLSHLVSVQPRPLAPLSYARLWTHIRDGIYHIPGGVDGLKELFIAKLREQCGDFRRSALVEKIVVKRGKATEVVLAGRGERLGCDLLVGNLPHRQLYNLIPAPQRKEPSVGEQEPSAWRMMVNVAVDPRVIPAGMGPEVVCVDEPRIGHTSGPSVWISRPGALTLGSEGRQGAGVLSVSVHQHARGLAPGVRAIQQSVNQTLDRLRWLIPWLDEHLQAVDVPALVKSTDRAGQELVKVDMSELMPIYAKPLAMSADVGGVGIQTQYRNIFLCEESIFGGLGFEGLCLGALQTLAATRRQLKLKTLRPNLS